MVSELVHESGTPLPIERFQLETLTHVPGVCGYHQQPQATETPSSGDVCDNYETVSDASLNSREDAASTRNG